jgi:hypothetical protein
MIVTVQVGEIFSQDVMCCNIYMCCEIYMLQGICCNKREREELDVQEVSVAQERASCVCARILNALRACKDIQY